MNKHVQFGARSLDLSRAKVMGILNVTPDSFSDGGRFFQGALVLDKVLRAAEKMVSDGASILDIGGESTRPGAAVVSEQEEMDRVVPVVAAIAERLDTIISVDTSSAKIIAEVAKSGAGMLNDVRALQRAGALEAAAKSGLPVCLMHMQGEPQVMQSAPSYQQVEDEVMAFLMDRMQACKDAGIACEKLFIDPGFGFGKTLEHNLSLMGALPEMAKRANLLVGLSRKSLIGQICQRDVGDRLPGSLALALLAAQSGASILRVHDVAETVDVLKILSAVTNNGVG